MAGPGLSQAELLGRRGQDGEIVTFSLSRPRYFGIHYDTSRYFPFVSTAISPVPAACNLSSLSHMNSYENIPVLPEAPRWSRLSHSVPASPAPAMITLESGLVGTRPGWSYLRESVKLGVRARLNSAATRTWIQYWNSTPLLTQLANARPAILKKIYRPYLSARLDCAARLALLMSHYDFIVRHNLGALVLRAAAKPVELAEFSGKSGTPYRIELAAMGQMEREGELVLNLLSDGVVIYSVAFAFAFDCAARAPSVAIGCLQGGRSEDALARISSATRDMHGLRPKSLMMRLVQQIGRLYGCQGLMLVGNANRVMHQQIRRGRVSADYDETWRELGAAPMDDGDFLLACTALAGPDLATIVSSKRSAARKRFALLASTAGMVCGALQARSKGANVVSMATASAPDFPDRYPVRMSRTA